MASYTAIADVGGTLVSLLEDRMGGLVDDDDIVLGSPGEEGPGEDFRLTLYLYDVRENEHLSNDRERPASTGPPAGASLVLDLHYLLTAHPKGNQSNDGRARKSRDQHTVLGRAMQVLEENAIVRKPDLDENLDARDTITISIESTKRADILDIWGTFTEVPYQPSVTYVVSPVVVESSDPDDDARVIESTVEEYTYTPAGQRGESGR